MQGESFPSESPTTVFTFEDDVSKPILRPWQLTCFTINVIMGSGFLGVPSGFVASGLVLGPCILLVVTALQWWAACLLAEVVARANALLTSADVCKWLTPTLVPFAHAEHASSASSGRQRIAPPSLTIPSHTSFEILMLCRLFLGKSAERVVTGCCVLYMVGCLWSFIAVFSSSLTAVVALPWLTADAPCDIYLTDVYGGGCINLYYSWVAVFAVCMVFLLLLEVSEQATMQVAMTAIRAAVILLMVSTLAVGSLDDFEGGGGGSEAAQTRDDAEASSPSSSAVPLVRWGGLAHMLPIAVFCQLFQIGVPALLEPLSVKRAYPSVFAIALLATYGMYTLLGAAAVAFFGASVDPSCNLNWQPYVVRPVATMVALFPAVDCLSVFPMNALFLANNLMSIALGDRWRSGGVPRTLRVASRLLCVLPPFACAVVFPSLSKALNFTGIVGIALAYIVTPALHNASLHKCRARWGAEGFDEAEDDTGFSLGFLSRPAPVLALGLVGTLLLLFCVGSGLTFGF